MPRARILCLLLTLPCALAVLAADSPPPASQPTSGVSPEGVAATLKRLHQVLPRVEISEIAFCDVVEFFRLLTNANLTVDWAALEEVGVEKTFAVSVQGTEMPLEALLTRMLAGVKAKKPLGFAIVPTPDAGRTAVVISTREALAKRKDAVWPSSAPVSKPTTAKSREAVSAMLKQIVPKLEFAVIAFPDVVGFLRDLTDTNFIVDWGELAYVGVDEAPPVTIRLAAMTLEECLTRILRSVKSLRPLGFAILPGTEGSSASILISTQEALAKRKDLYWPTSAPATAPATAPAR